jgi:hypothetical protein
MTDRTLHLSKALKETLHGAQLDALELACIDCSFGLRDAATPADLLAGINDSSISMVALAVSDLVALALAEAALPGRRIIVVPTERENPALAGLADRLSPLRYVVGAQTPALMRGLLASILSFRSHGAVGGLLQSQPVGPFARETYKLTHSSQRALFQEKVTAFFESQMAAHKAQCVSGTGSFPKNAGDVLDEFLMNAIWDACLSRNEMDRTRTFALPEHESVSVECASDGVNLILTVSDGFGTFPETSMVKPVRHALGLKPAAQINEGPGGAGLGLYMILQKVACLAYEVHRGGSTRAIALLRTDQSLRELQKRPRSVLFFEH